MGLSKILKGPVGMLGPRLYAKRFKDLKIRIGKKKNWKKSRKIISALSEWKISQRSSIDVVDQKIEIPQNRQN